MTLIVITIKVSGNRLNIGGASPRILQDSSYFLKQNIHTLPTMTSSRTRLRCSADVSDNPLLLAQICVPMNNSRKATIVTIPNALATSPSVLGGDVAGENGECFSNIVLKFMPDCGFEYLVIFERNDSICYQGSSGLTQNVPDATFIWLACKSQYSALKGSSRTVLATESRVSWKTGGICTPELALERLT